MVFLVFPRSLYLFPGLLSLVASSHCAPSSFGSVPLRATMLLLLLLIARTDFQIILSQVGYEVFQPHHLAKSLRYACPWQRKDGELGNVTLTCVGILFFFCVEEASEFRMLHLAPASLTELTVVPCVSYSLRGVCWKSRCNMATADTVLFSLERLWMF